jgi:hypothetical protein
MHTPFSLKTLGLTSAILCLTGCDISTQAGPSNGEPGNTVDTGSTEAGSGLAPGGTVQLNQVPEDSPGVILLMSQNGDGEFTVDGTVMAEIYVDTDQTRDDRQGFRYQIYDEQGLRVFERTVNGPAQVRTYMEFYGTGSDISVLESFPLLGTFSLTVPIIDDADTVRFQLRNEDGTYEDAGTYDLGQRKEDNVGKADSVIGFQTIVSNVEPSQGLDIAIIGDGYTRDELSMWIDDANNMAGKIMSTAPFSTHANRINIHRVDAISKESGVSWDCVGDCQMRDTAFGSIFAVELVNRMLGTDYSTVPIFQLQQWEVARAASVVPYDLVLVVANTSRAGGFAAHYATVTKDDDNWTDTGVHELGHILGVLGDEYMSNDCVTDARIALPVNISDDPADPKWSHWIEAGTPLPTPNDADHRQLVGAFEGAYNCPEMVRPAHTCKMKRATHEFCAVCTEALTQEIYQYADFVESVEVETTDTAHTIQVKTSWPQAWVTLIVDGVATASGSPANLFTVPIGVTTLDVEVQLISDTVRATDDRMTERVSITFD